MLFVRYKFQHIDHNNTTLTLTFPIYPLPSKWQQICEQNGAYLTYIGFLNISNKASNFDHKYDISFSPTQYICSTEASTKLTDYLIVANASCCFHSLPESINILARRNLNAKFHLADVYFASSYSSIRTKTNTGVSKYSRL